MIHLVYRISICDCSLFVYFVYTICSSCLRFVSFLHLNRSFQCSNPINYLSYSKRIADFFLFNWWIFKNYKNRIFLLFWSNLLSIYIKLYIYLSISLSINQLPIHLSTYLLSTYLSIYLFIYISMSTCSIVF